MINKILEERGARYGEYVDGAETAQDLKWVMRNNDGWLITENVAREALDNIQQKIARIINGDDSYPDNWIDIIGYAQLVLNEIAPEDINT